MLDYVEKNIVSADRFPKDIFVNDSWKTHLFFSDNYISMNSFNAIKVCAINFFSERNIFYVNYLYYDLMKRIKGLDDKEIMNIKYIFNKIPFDWDAFDREAQKNNMGKTGLYVWGESERWAMFLPDEYYFAVSGEHNFMRCLEKEYGGAESH